MVYVGEYDSEILLILGEPMIYYLLYEAGQRQMKPQPLYMNRRICIYRCICTCKHISLQHTQFQSWSAGQASRVTALLHALTGCFIIVLTGTAWFCDRYLVVSGHYCESNLKNTGNKLSCLNPPGVDHTLEEYLGLMLVRSHAKRTHRQQGRWLFSHC